jgi:hypothetical protein
LPLAVGLATHEGLDAYYHSAPDTGDYNLTSAIAAAEEYILTLSTRFQDPNDMASAIAQTSGLLRTYHDWYGKDGENPEWREYKVAHDKLGRPLIERTLEVDVHAPMPFTGRIDTVVEHRDSFYAMEHKTAAPHRVTRTFQQLRMGTQARGQVILLKENFPDLPIRGILANVLVKGAAKGKPPVHRELITFSNLELAKAKADIGETLREIDIRRNNWRGDLADGPEAAALMNFPMYTHSCVHEFGQCEFAQLCRNLEHQPSLLGTFIPKHQD